MKVLSSKQMDFINRFKKIIDDQQPIKVERFDIENSVFDNSICSAEFAPFIFEGKTYEIYWDFVGVTGLKVYLKTDKNYFGHIEVNEKNLISYFYGSDWITFAEAQEIKLQEAIEEENNRLIKQAVKIIKSYTGTRLYGTLRKGGVEAILSRPELLQRARKIAKG